MNDLANAPVGSKPARPRPVSASEGYQLWAPTYDLDPNPLLAAEERAVSPMLCRVAGMRVLDVACGTGRWLERVVRAGATAAAGVDLSRAMLEVARSKPCLPGRLVRGDGLLLPFRNEAADFVICSFALSHIERLHLIAREIARVARRDGEIWVSDLHPEARAAGWITGFHHEGGSANIVTYDHSSGEICNDFGAEGLSIIEWQDVRLGEHERAVFQRAGRSRLYDCVRTTPAIYVARFGRESSV